jgi:UDP-N-acetylmuramoyl-tripeptide--D-alanyl-D-alanine ligase
MLVSLSTPRLVVDDTTKALGDLAAYYRAKFKIPFIAIAGSNGKTTTKNMISAVLGTKYNVLATEGNLNNQIGVPQTLFRLADSHDVAVVEIGTNHFGELAYLCKILAPTHGLITNIGHEHLEFFRTLDGVAKAEGELITWLRSRKGTFFLNKDDGRLVKQTRVSKGMKVIPFGFRARATAVKGTLASVNEHGCARLKVRHKAGTISTIQLGVPGEQNAANALAAATVGVALKVPAKSIAKALESFVPAGKRSELIRLNGLTVINDTYNANPDSVLAALKTMRSMTVNGRRIAVLGDMLELGVTAEQEHRAVGKSLSRNKVDCLFTFGEFTKHTSDAAAVRVKKHFATKAALAEELALLVRDGDVVLVKGSRGMKMEEIVAALQQKHS